ncbi:peroxiredoxin-like family protein [Psychrobacter sp. M13]|uniref:peroxiredoxin-like family protein n=1 Tax=Psychrobacter sp. M13 TaxID=3067275 RepID=UPI00273AA072|nr:peroxiredoxin-like family protein [Psychrobacter sp. M13]WLP93399.1 peroxiredoxin-like family protein [Psychrobacter sp. M13]
MQNANTQKPQAGSKFPDIEVTMLNGDTKSLGKPENGHDWKLVVVYRGQHCPICTKYLNQLETVKKSFYDTGVDIIAVSADSKEQLESHLEEKIDINFPIAYGLSVEQMNTLGLYISDPRSEKETDHPFAEPGVFVINAKGEIHIIDISNAPFARPELESLASGLSFIRENDYPIRGTHI